MNSLKRIFYLALTLLVFIVNVPKTKAQSNKDETTRILFVFDCSQSMWGRWDAEAKITIARRVMSSVMDSLKSYKHLELGLRLFGSEYSVNDVGQNCEDTKLAIPFGNRNEDKITETLNKVYPKGTTPIAYSLLKAGGDFPKTKEGRNVIILITDGIEECDGDPCAVARILRKKKISLKPFVIGLGLDKNIVQSLKCVGNYFNATDEKSFHRIMGVIISQVMNQTSAQVNLLDAGGDPTETNVAITFYDTHSGTQKYNFIHTLNARGLPDTVPIDPTFEYNMIVHTIPEVEKDSIELKPGIKNIIAVDAAQGELMVTSPEASYNNLAVIVRQSGKMKTLNVQNTEQEIKYLTGVYDIEILTLPRLYVQDVNISQSHLTKVQIPQPGQLSLMLNNQGYGSIFKTKGEHLEWVCNLLTNTDQQTFKLLPGSYKVVFRSINAHKIILSKEEEFTITSGISTRLTID